MITGKLIQPFLLCQPKNKARYDYIKNHLAENGIDDYYEVAGINADEFGITCNRTYKRDNPDSDYIQPNHKTGCTLSHFLMYSVMATHHDADYYFLIEDDCIFLEGWQEQLQKALDEDVPDDFDFLLVGNCCTDGREKTHIAGNVYEVKYPLCTHAMIISAKAIPILLENCRDASQPIDVLLFYEVFPKCKVYTILPRLADQKDTELVP